MPVKEVKRFVSCRISRSSLGLTVAGILLGKLGCPFPHSARRPAPLVHLPGLPACLAVRSSILALHLQPQSFVQVIPRLVPLIISRSDRAPRISDHCIWHNRRIHQQGHLRRVGEGIRYESAGQTQNFQARRCWTLLPCGRTWPMVDGTDQRVDQRIIGFACHRSDVFLRLQYGLGLQMRNRDHHEAKDHSSVAQRDTPLGKKRL